MKQLQSFARNLRLVSLGLLAISSVVGCTSGKGGLSCLKKDKGCEEVMGVDDAATHGHRKTCWRAWDEPAWQAQCCPVYMTASSSASAPTHFPGVAPPVPSAEELPPKTEVAPPADLTPPMEVLPQAEDLQVLE